MKTIAAALTHVLLTLALAHASACSSMDVVPTASIGAGDGVPGAGDAG